MQVFLKTQVEDLVFLILQLFDNCCNSFSPSRAAVYLNFQPYDATAKLEQFSNPLLISLQKRGLGPGQLQNNCPLFVWRNQGNAMQSVIKYGTHTFESRDTRYLPRYLLISDFRLALRNFFKAIDPLSFFYH